MSRYLIILSFLTYCGCSNPTSREKINSSEIRQVRPAIEGPSIIVLGNVQDAGSPHIGCNKQCCRDLKEHPDPMRMVASLGLVDPVSGKRYLFDATPDMPRQLRMLRDFTTDTLREVPDGIFLTHAHIGHYTGLMYLGKEAIDAQAVPVFAMKRMREFLKTSGPWSQLVNRRNIVIRNVENDQAIELDGGITVTPILVPHRDEYSETVGFRIKGPNRIVLYIPDIDKWEKWDRHIEDEIKKVDVALLDGTFCNDEEIKGRDMSEIPHPFVVETTSRFKDLPASEKAKVIFIHFNHTNPLLNPDDSNAIQLLASGYRIARTGDIIPL